MGRQDEAWAYHQRGQRRVVASSNGLDLRELFEPLKAARYARRWAKGGGRPPPSKTGQEEATAERTDIHQRGGRPVESPVNAIGERAGG